MLVVNLKDVTVNLDFFYFLRGPQPCISEHIDEDKDLVASIQREGFIVPVIVRPDRGRSELISYPITTGPVLSLWLSVVSLSIGHT